MEWRKVIVSKAEGVCRLCVAGSVSPEYGGTSEQFTKLLSTLDELRSSQPSACGETLRKEWVGSVARDCTCGTMSSRRSIQQITNCSGLLECIDRTAGCGRRDPGFSYLTTRQLDESQYTSGAYIGFGFRSALDPRTRYFWRTYSRADRP